LGKEGRERRRERGKEEEEGEGRGEGEEEREREGVGRDPTKFREKLTPLLLTPFSKYIDFLFISLIGTFLFDSVQ